MPYIAKGKCVYKKNKDGSAGEKVGCTDGSVDDYLASLYANTDEAKQAPMNINLDTLVEMVERQLILSEQENPQSIYKTVAKLRINKARGGDMTQLLNEIRGIEGVTTVNHQAEYSRKTETFDFVIFEMKFELVGREANPQTYMRNTLVPGIREIIGVDVQDIKSHPEKLS